MRASRFLAAALLCLAAAPARAEVYRWVDGEGRVHYTSDLHQVPPDRRQAAQASAAEPRAPRGTLEELGSGGTALRASDPAPRRSAVAQAAGSQSA